MQPLARVPLQPVLPCVDEHRDSGVKAEEVERLGEEVPDDGSPDLSDSASAGSSVPALNVLLCGMCSREDDSSEDDRRESEAPTCPSITLGSDGENESVGSSVTT